MLASVRHLKQLLDPCQYLYVVVIEVQSRCLANAINHRSNTLACFKSRTPITLQALLLASGIASMDPVPVGSFIFYGVLLVADDCPRP